MSEHWNPTKKEIEKSLDKKVREFAVQEKRNARISEEKWLERYLYTEIHEILFASFQSELI